MSKPTHQDGLMLLAIKSWSHGNGYREASRLMWSDDFPLELAEFEKKFQGKPEEDQVYFYFEVLDVIGRLYKHGLIHQDLLFNDENLSVIWERFKNLILEARESWNSPTLMANFEALAKAEKEYRGE